MGKAKKFKLLRSGLRKQVAAANPGEKVTAELVKPYYKRMKKVIFGNGRAQ